MINRVAVIIVLYFQPFLLMAESFPLSFMGSWKGHCRLISESDSSKFKVNLFVAEDTEKHVYIWRIEYFKEGNYELRDYRLLTNSSGSSSFTIDERNGLFLDGTYIDGKMIMLFSVNKSVILSSVHWVKNNTLKITMPYWDYKTSRTSTTFDSRNRVESYKLVGNQVCELKRDR